MCSRQRRPASISAISSDHLNPWSPRQGQSEFAWTCSGAALATTARLSFGAVTIPGGWRYHPVVLAQAIATLGQIFPGRLPWVALGSGQSLYERVESAHWPRKPERWARLEEGAALIKALLRGDTVSHDGAQTAQTPKSGRDQMS